MSPSPKVCAIVLNYKAWQHTLECLEAVYSSDYPDFEVMVVDNGSGDESPDRILAWARGETPRQTPATSPVHGSASAPGPVPYAYFDDQGDLLAEGNPESALPRLTLVRSGPARGCYGGFNLGIRESLRRADCRYVWLLPNDTAVEKSCLSRQVRRAEAEGWGVCGARAEYYDAPGTVQELGGRFHPYSGRKSEIRDPEELEHLDYVGGNAMLVSRACLEATGPLPEAYFLYFEDVDFCHAARAAGIRLGVATDAVVYHKDGKSSTKALKEYYFARNLLRFVGRRMPLHLPFALWHVLAHRVTMKILGGNSRSVPPLLRGVRDFFLGRSGPKPGPDHG